MEKCPWCRGTGAGRSLHGPPRVGVGDHIMVAVSPTHTRVEVVGFKHSGVGQVNDGTYTVCYPNARTQSITCNSGTSGFHKLCPRCGGHKAVELLPLDRAIMAGDLFRVSGRGQVRVGAATEHGTRMAYSNIWLRPSDLLTKDEQVYKVDGNLEFLHYHYVFKLRHVGDTNVEEFYTTRECATHGWYLEATCPECPSAQVSAC